MFRPILLSLAMTFSAQIVLGQTPRPCQPPALRASSQEANIFTEKQEVDLGDAIAEHIQRNFHVIDYEEVTGYLNRIGQRIVKHLPPSSLRFQFVLVDLSDANAFVLPGGRIYVARKLVALAQSEDELAGVLGHEIGHLLARQGSIRVTRQFREVLGVTDVKDRHDIFEKYNQLMDNVARKPKAFNRGDRKEDEQLVADQVGLFAVAAAGYNPEAHARIFDRITENKGRTGGFLSDLFGTTKPESKRLREMIKVAEAMPASCIDARAAASEEEFQKWQGAVVSYTGLGRREAIHSLLKKTALEPPLRGEINHFRFSPDGKFVLAQDDSAINVLSVEPFVLLFRIEAPEAKPAQFTPDSQDIVFHNSVLRVEVWSVADQKLKAAHELFTRKGCLQTLLSPSGGTLACLDGELNLTLLDASTGNQIFQKKDFYTPDILAVLFLRLQSILDTEENSGSQYEWINMGFSPDGRYFAAGARGVNNNSIGYFSTQSAAVVDLTTRESVPLRGSLKKLLAGGFTFLAPDRLIGIDRSDLKKSLLVSFPGGETLDQVPLGGNHLAAATRGNYVLLRPVVNYPVGVMDISTKKIFMANKLGALDVYDQMFVSERTNGEIGIYGTEKRELKAKALLPRNPLGRLRATALSRDLRWLAVSERTRGAVWDLARGERVFHIRGFRGGHFAEDGAFYADFPKYEETERTVARLDLTKRDVVPGSEVKGLRATQHGPFILVTRPVKKDGGFNENVILEMQDVRTSSVLWSKAFPKEAPQAWMDDQAMVLSWPLSASAAQAEIKADESLTAQIAALKEKEGDYFLQVLDPRTGKAIGRLLVETGKGSFRISRAFVAGDWVVIFDTQNRVRLYSLSSGIQKGKVFGSKAALSPVSKLLCVENESGKLTVYDLDSMEQRDQFAFSSPVSLARFSSDGKSLFVLTASQTVYLLDVSSLSR